MRVPQSFLEGLIMFFLLIPIAVYYLLVWIIKGLITLVVMLKE